MVARMRSAGAIIIGVTSMTEYGVTPLGWSAHAQGPRNPFRTGHFSGGSSSGSAVAVAVGLVPMAIGFDGGGSIRIPAALSGVVGLAATFGRIEYHAGAIVSMIKAGPLAATVADAALSYVWLAGGSDPLSGDATRLPSHTTSHGYGVDGPPQAHIHGWEQVSELSGMRIGLFPEWYDDAVPEVREQVHAAVHRLEALGVEVVQIRIPNMLALSLSHGITISSEFSWEHDRKFSDGWPLEPSTVIQLVLGRAISAVEVHAANRLRSWSMELIGGLFKEHRLDSIVTPTVGRTAPPLPPGAMSDGTSDTSVVVDLMKHIFLANLLGLPAISVPVGLGRETELPCAIQLIGEWWEEAKLLRLANALGADSEGGALPRPPHFFSELDALLLDVGVAERTP
jgi:Asp-tRNA(Asn)/Glu-tRNA(Gln) amidotransferase A subunit family amidase